MGAMPTTYSNVYNNPYMPVNPGDVTTKGGLNRGLWSVFGTAQGLGKQTQGQRGSEYGSLLPQYQSLLNSGYSPQEKSGIEQATLGSVQGAYGSALDSASRRMARTGNSAGYGSFLGATARSKASDLAQQSLNNQKLFADEALRRKMMGLQGIAQLYGIDTSFLNSLNQTQLGALGVGQSVQSGRRGVLGNIGAGMSLFGL